MLKSEPLILKTEASRNISLKIAHFTPKSLKIHTEVSENVLEII
jgi:hypothetical protein